jgi:hypothetical protein
MALPRLERGLGLSPSFLGAACPPGLALHPVEPLVQALTQNWPDEHS